MLHLSRNSYIGIKLIISRCLHKDMIVSQNSSEFSVSVN